jgi:hypothetical protein
VDCVQSGQHGVGGERKTRNNGKTRHKPVLPTCAAFAQVCPVVSRSNPLDGWRSEGPHTERSWTAAITTVSHSSSSISSSQSHSSCSQSPHSGSNPVDEGKWLASHSCEAGLSQGHPPSARYHTTTCQQLPTPQRESLHRAAQLRSTGWVHTRLARGWMM